MSKVSPAGNVEMRFFMVADRLCRLPPRFGGCRTAPPQLNKSSHFVTELASFTTDRSSDAKCEARADLADLGMCLIRAESGGDQIGVDVAELADETVAGTDETVAV